MTDYAPDYLLGFYAICVFVVLNFEGVLDGALCLCERERERACFSETMLSKVRPSCDFFQCSISGFGTQHFLDSKLKNHCFPFLQTLYILYQVLSR